VSVTASRPPPGMDPELAASIWTDACLAAALLAVDPHGLGGLNLRALPGPVRDAWLEVLRELLGEDPRRLPLNIPDSRLLGGLDLAMTLRAGRPVAERGLLAEADGGVLVVAMAERLRIDVAGKLGVVLDRGEVAVQRDGIQECRPARIGLVTLDEGVDEGERPPAALRERLAFAIDFAPVPMAATRAERVPITHAEVLEARARLGQVTVPAAVVEALCGASAALGVESLRGPLLAARVARVAAALSGRDGADEDDAALATRLVLLPRATRLPVPQASDPAPDEPEADPPPPEVGSEPTESSADTPLDASAPPAPPAPGEAVPDSVQEAVAALLPEGLLNQLRLQATLGGLQRRTPGQGGAARQGATRGRPAGVRKGTPRPGERINVVETLRAAAPWQRLRRDAHPDARTGVLVRAEDFRITRHKNRSETTTIFSVDASGSAAAARLAEAKGAVELLLADCYVRRDRVALIAFRGARAELLLPPTRSLVRAKRSLAGLPGGGGTPLALGIDEARGLAGEVRRHGGTPVLVLLTDGRANVDRAGIGGRRRAMEDALAAAMLLRVLDVQVLLVDTSAQPGGAGRQLAEAMGGGYLPLPYATAATIDKAVRGALTAGGERT
jgi:magnesium chelatase subunit D